MKQTISKEFRCVRGAEIRAAESKDDAIGVLEGYAVVFNKEAQLRKGIFEKFADRAFDKCDLSDVLLIGNHDLSRIPYARHRRGSRSTMEITIDEKGVFYRATVDLSNPSVKEIHSAVKRGDIEGASLMFMIRAIDVEFIEGYGEIRTITDVSKVWEFSLVNFPAYGETSAEARSCVPALDNEESALENAVREALENEKRQTAEALEVRRKKILSKMEDLR